MDFKRQLEDYTAAVRAYLIAATGEATERIIFATPDLAKRKLKEKLNDTNEDGVLDRTIEIDTFVSFYIPFSQGLPSFRDSIRQNFQGAKAMGTGKPGFVSNIDIPIVVDIWGGPVQKGSLYVFDKELKLKNYWKRNRTLSVQFRDLITKNKTATPLVPFDVNGDYNLELENIMDSSMPQEQYNTGANYRTTLEFILSAAFYDVSGDTIQQFTEIQVEYEALRNDEARIEVDVQAPGD